MEDGDEKERVKNEGVRSEMRRMGEMKGKGEMRGMGEMSIAEFFILHCDNL